MQPPTEKYGMFFLGQFMWYGIAISKDWARSLESLHQRSWLRS
jgi:hypothetical protein